jgi:hypothetical protein
MSSPFKYALFFICISVSMAPIAFAEKNTLGEEISILDNDVLDQAKFIKPKLSSLP